MDASMPANEDQSPSVNSLVKRSCALTALHFVVAGLARFMSGMHDMATLEPSSSSLLPEPVHQTISLLSNVLGMPIGLLWTSRPGANIPEVGNMALFIINSCLWGFFFAWLYSRLRLRLGKVPSPGSASRTDATE